MPLSRFLRLTLSCLVLGMGLAAHAQPDQPIKLLVGFAPGGSSDLVARLIQAGHRRIGFLTLRETIDTIDPNGSITGKIVSYALQMAFLNPDKYAEIGPGAITQGMTHQQAGDVDEFMTPALNQGLLGMPLDLAAINIARGRDLGIPTLNAMRSALGVQAYDSWASFAEGMGHKESLPAFIAAYAFNGDMAKAQEIVDLANGVITSGTGPMGWTIGNAIAFMNNAFTAADTAITELVDGAKAVDFIDSWINGGYFVIVVFMLSYGGRTLGLGIPTMLNAIMVAWKSAMRSSSRAACLNVWHSRRRARSCLRSCAFRWRRKAMRSRKRCFWKAPPRPATPASGFPRRAASASSSSSSRAIRRPARTRRSASGLATRRS